MSPEIFDWSGWLKAEWLAREWPVSKVAARTGVTSIHTMETVISHVEQRKVNLSMRTSVLVTRGFNVSPYVVFMQAN